MMLNGIKSISDIVSTLKRLLSNRQKHLLILVFASMIIVTVVDVLGVSTVFPLLQVIENAELSDTWIDILQLVGIEYDNTLDLLRVFAIGIALLFIIKNALAIICIYIQQYYATNFCRELSERILNLYMCKPYEYFVNSNSSNILRSLNNDTESIYQVLISILYITTEMLTCLFIGVYLLYVDATLAIGAVLIAAVASLIIVIGFKNRIKYAGDMYARSISNKNRHILHISNGIKEIKVFDKSDYFKREFHSAAKEYEKATRDNFFISACPDRIIEGICIGGFMIVILLKIILVGSTDDIIPVLAVFAMGAFKILPSFSKISTRINMIVFYQKGLINCNELLEGYTEQYCVIKDDIDKETFDNCIEISNVDWKYSGSAKNVLSNINIKILKNESIAIIGESGSGKSTLIDILLGLYVPNQGTVLVDGIELNNIKKSWSKLIGYIPQTVYLIDDTIRANIAFGIDSNSIDDKQIWLALEEAQLADFVRSLPEQLDTMVGERGIKFSGGQRQRIAIARALYNNPQVIIMDEATSALDNETESALMDAVNRFRHSKTIIIVAHRLSTISNCDKVYEIKDGKISIVGNN